MKWLTLGWIFALDTVSVEGILILAIRVASGRPSRCIHEMFTALQTNIDDPFMCIG
jgi:hypothetical protein